MFALLTGGKTNPQNKAHKHWGTWCSRFMTPKPIPPYSLWCMHWWDPIISFLLTARLMLKFTWLNPHKKEDEALKIQRRRNTRLRLHLEGDKSLDLPIVHLNRATVRAQALTLSWTRGGMREVGTLKRGEGLPLHLQPHLLHLRCKNHHHPW